MNKDKKVPEVLHRIKKTGYVFSSFRCLEKGVVRVCGHMVVVWLVMVLMEDQAVLSVR